MRNLNVGNDFAFQNREIEDDRDRDVKVVHEKDKVEKDPGREVSQEAVQEEKGKAKKQKPKAKQV